MRFVLASHNKGKLAEMQAILGELGVDHILEVGPGNALSGFVKKTVPGIPVCAVETAADVENLPDTLEQLIKEKA